MARIVDLVTRRRLPIHAALILATLAWLLGSVAAFVHVIQVRHAVCEDHGQVVELGEAGSAETTGGPVWAPTIPDEHDHGCALPTQATPPLVMVSAVPVALAEPPPEDDAPPLQVQAPPPLRAAPKTSPPSQS